MHLAALLMLGGCSTAPTIDGKVVDIWGEPIEGATVLMVGQGARPLTDSEGRYSFPHVTGSHVLKAGKDSYIQEHAELEVAGSEPTAGPTFELYKKPEENGFFVIGSTSYSKLDSQVVHTKGSGFAPLRGLKAKEATTTDKPDLTVIFHTDAKYEEVLQMDLELHQLEFLKEKELTGTFGQETVEVNLFVSKGEIPIEIEPMRSPTDYLIKVEKPLEPGNYAFQTQDLLDSPDQEAFDRISEEFQKVFPIAIR